MPVPFKYEV